MKVFCAMAVPPDDVLTLVIALGARVAALHAFITAV
jgi:hypothetical protein